MRCYASLYHLVEVLVLPACVTCTWGLCIARHGVSTWSDRGHKWFVGLNDIVNQASCRKQTTEGLFVGGFVCTV
jgi:hypothetical protein